MNGALSEGSRGANHVEKEALIEPLVGIVHKHLNNVLLLSLETTIMLKSWPPGGEELGNWGTQTN